MEIYVTKNSGELELYDPEKINEKVLYACEGLSNVNASDILMNTNIKIVNKIKSSEIQKALVQSAAELITAETPNYDIVASRLLNQKLRKEVYGQYAPKDFLTCVKYRVKEGWYDKSILEDYTEAEIEYFGTKIKYQLDEKLNYNSMSQMYHKYILKDKDRCIETPQEVFMLMQLYIFAKSENRKKWILEGYKLLSNREVSFPTPVMNGLRTNFKKFISCNVIDAGDSTKSLALTNARILQMTASKSGIGLNMSRIRGLGAEIGKGRVKHTGILPLAKAFEAATGALTQQSRGGSANANYPFFHYEIELICQLKDTRGTYETRCRHMDITIMINKWFMEKVLKKEDIFIFHMNEVPGLYEALGDYEKFDILYKKYSKSVTKEHKKKINAYTLFNMFLFERSLTGRLYFVFADNIAKGPWKEPVYNTNLCCEITLPNKPLDGSLGTPEIASCILASLNHGYIKDERIPVACEYLIRFLDNMIDYMTYDMEEVEYSSTKRRALGIGHSDLFHFLAKNKKFYNTEEGKELIHRRMESSYYNLLKASNKLAKEKGKCELYNDTTYSEGWLSFKDFDNTYQLQEDWQTLEKDIKEYGLRNSTVSACAPCGNSAVVSNSTSGVEPPRELETLKEDKNFKILKLVPDYERLKNYYTTSWGYDFNNIDYFKMLGIVQKFVDQAISTNQYTNTFKYEDQKIPLKDVYNEILTAMNSGLKTLYYQNFKANDNIDGLKEEQEEQKCGSGGCEI